MRPSSHLVATKLAFIPYDNENTRNKVLRKLRYLRRMVELDAMLRTHLTDIRRRDASIRLQVIDSIIGDIESEDWSLSMNGVAWCNTTHTAYFYYPPTST